MQGKPSGEKQVHEFLTNTVRKRVDKWKQARFYKKGKEYATFLTEIYYKMCSPNYVNDNLYFPSFEPIGEKVYNYMDYIDILLVI